MGKRWIWVIAIGLVLLGGAWNSAVAGVAFDLTKLKTLCVAVEKLDPDIERHLGLSQEAVINHVFVWLKAKLPRLRIVRHTGKETAACMRSHSLLMVNAHLGVGKAGGRKTGFYGSLIIHLIRSTVWETGEAGAGIAYHGGMIIKGPLTSTKYVYDSLDELLTEFAAEYYKAGNP